MIVSSRYSTKRNNSSPLYQCRHASMDEAVTEHTGNRICMPIPIRSRFLTEKVFNRSSIVRSLGSNFGLVQGFKINSRSSIVPLLAHNHGSRRFERFICTLTSLEGKDEVRDYNIKARITCPRRCTSLDRQNDLQRAFFSLWFSRGIELVPP